MKTIFITLFVFLGCTFFVSSIRGQNLRDKEKQVKDQILGRPYDGQILPRSENNPVDVIASLQLQKQLVVDGHKRTVEATLLLKLEWNEPRFTYTSFPPNSGPYQVTLPSSSLDNVWTPDLYFVNSEKTEYESRYMKVYSNGNVLYTVLAKVTFLCPLNFKYFPHDVQTCDLKISSFAYNINDMRLRWRDPDPLSIGDDISVPEFVLQKASADICSPGPDLEEPKEVKTCIKLGLTVKRTFSYYLVQVYIPCSMLIIISWLSYFLHPVKSATARLGLAIVALGLAVIGTTSFNSKLPIVSRTKSLDVWTGISLTFIFLAVVEFVVVNYLNQYGCCRSSTKVQKQIHDTSDAAEQQAPLNPSGEDKCSSETLSTSGPSKLGTMLDIIFRITIPILFVVFMVLYWLFLT